MSAPETNLGTVTSWIPLTTAYPSVSGCALSFWSVVADTIAGWDPGYGRTVDANLRCHPSQVTTWWNSQPAGLPTRYSIGPIVCPEAYSTATTLLKDKTSTFVACCPSGYTFAGTRDWGQTGECVTDLVRGQVIAYAVDNDQGTWVTSRLTVTSPTTAAGIQVNGWNVAEQTSVSITPTLSTGSATSPSESNNARTDSPVSPSASGLSRGVVAAIVVAACLGAVFLTGVVFAFIFHRRHQQKRRQLDQAANTDFQPSKSFRPKRPLPPEMGITSDRGKVVHEMGRQVVPDRSLIIHEMDVGR